MKRKTLRYAATVIGAVLVALFLASITASLVSPHTRCDACQSTLAKLEERDAGDCRVILYGCPNKDCGETWQQTLWDDGRVEWQKW